MNVLFICKKRIDGYGVSVGLINSARFVSHYLNHQGIKSEVIEITDANSIDREVTNRNPTHVIIEALWVSPDKFKELFNIHRHRNRTWVVRIHSKIPFLAQEGMAIEWIKSYLNILTKTKFYVSPNTKELVSDIKTISPYSDEQIVYLPNIYFPKDEIISIADSASREAYINVGSFGAIRPLKNTLMQAVSAIEFAEKKGKKLAFHINGNRIEGGADNIHKNLIAVFDRTEHKLVQHHWMNHKHFLGLVGSMDLGNQ